MADSASQRKPTFFRKRLSGDKVLELILAETDSEDEVRKDTISEDESDEDFVPDEPTSEIEDNIDTIANSSTDDESEKVRLVLPYVEERASDISGLSIAVQRAMQAMLNRPTASLPQSTAAAGSKVRKCHLHTGWVREGLQTVEAVC